MLPSLPALASDSPPPSQLRLFVGNQSISPTDVNNVLTAGAMHTYDSITDYGLEMSYRLVPRTNLGVRVEGKWQKLFEIANPPADPQNPYYSSIQQTSAQAVLRVSMIETPVVRMDVYGGFGPTNTSMDIRTASGDSNYSRNVNSYMSSAGASLGIGFGNVFFTVEVGKEWNKVTNPTKSGAASATLNTIDLSGTYVDVGLLFNGIPSWMHRK